MAHCCALVWRLSLSECTSTYIVFTSQCAFEKAHKISSQMRKNHKVTKKSKIIPKVSE